MTNPTGLSPHRCRLLEVQGHPRKGHSGLQDVRWSQWSSRRHLRRRHKGSFCRSSLTTPLTPQAALFPCGISLAATWNKDLLFQVGQHLADETKARSAEMLLAPTVCMHRHPLGGRNFESFSEDPLLTGKLAAQYINGLQDKGVAAAIKRLSPCSPSVAATDAE